MLLWRISYLVPEFLCTLDYIKVTHLVSKDVHRLAADLCSVSMQF
uniref:Uncharacterized protein n=1 Tax=Anguilla anguilla TaxID=7936 RepID=A0A0E9PHQ9_ANGAN